MSDKRTGKKTKAIRPLMVATSDTPIVVSDLTQHTVAKKKHRK